jgi:hypothetical protein
MMPSGEVASYSYAILSFVVDDARDVTLPVGVALWSPQRHLVRMRVIGEKERLTGFKAQEHLPFVRLVEEKLRHWIETGEIPYREKLVAPFTDDWWRHARELLVHRVRLSEPRPIDCRDAETELNVLYESVVAPHRPAKEVRTRIDGEIGKCLNDLGKKFKGRRALPGYGGRKVQVKRVYEGEKGCVVIEGVNLAGKTAEAETDATASKLQRVQRGVGAECHFLIGYLASPEGLNGESVLVDWLRETTHAEAFDLMKERQDFHSAAERLVSQAGEQGDLFVRGH